MAIPTQPRTPTSIPIVAGSGTGVGVKVTFEMRPVTVCDCVGLRVLELTVGSLVTARSNVPEPPVVVYATVWAVLLKSIVAFETVLVWFTFTLPDTFAENVWFGLTVGSENVNVSVNVDAGIDPQFPPGQLSVNVPISANVALPPIGTSALIPVPAKVSPVTVGDKEPVVVPVNWISGSGLTGTRDRQASDKG